MSLLIDADYIVYKCCASAETEIDWGDDVIMVTSRFSEALKLVENELFSIAECLGCFDDSILFFSDSVNFRKTIDPDYKGHRNRKKPCGYKRVIAALKESYPVVILPSLEADDAMGIYATKENGHIICSPDKDMRQIPGDLFDMKEGVVTIDKEEADQWHLIQTLAGDQTDGYSGVPGIGIKRAVTLFEKEGYSWDTVLKAFESKDLDEDVAIRNARLAKILRAENYDLETKTVIPWNPAADC
jgi:5'-3' exonuclease